MNAAETVVKVRRIQAAFQVLTLLQLTAVHWPPQAVVSDGASYDFIIVGAGSAGCVLANRLTEDGRFSVLLVEAGGDPPFESMMPGLSLTYLLQADYDWNIKSAFDQNRKLYQKDIVMPLPQGKMLGGSSSMSVMDYDHGNRRDYQGWAEAAGDDTWNYENVLPYFKKSEHNDDPLILNSKYREFHGTSGFLHVTSERRPKKEYFSMTEELGLRTLLDINGNDSVGFVDPLFVSAKGVRQSTAFSFLTPIRHRHNLHVLKYARVVRILFDECKNAIGVKLVAENSETLTMLANKEVIVTAGGLNSPKLLLLSGIGPRGHLSTFGIETISDLPVGENLEDHPACIAAYTLKETSKTPGPINYAQPDSTTIVGYIPLNKTEKYPDYLVFFHYYDNKAEILVQWCVNMLGQNFDTCEALYETAKGKEIILLIVALFRPKSRGVIQLKSADPFDDPLVFLRHFSDESDLDKLAASLADFDKIKETTHYKSVGGEFVDFKLPQCQGLEIGSEEYWRCHVLSTRMTMYHYTGACAMGSVVDSHLRVRGVQRLRVADSSAIPLIPSGNINAPTIMLAEKAADMIKEDHK